MITTKAYKSSASFIARLEIRRRLLGSLWLLIFPAMAFILGATVNNAFIYVGLILIFLIYPFILTIAYFNSLLLPGYASAVRTKRVVFEEDCLSIQHLKLDDDGNEENNGTPITIPYSDFSEFDFASENIVLRYKDSNKGIIAVPKTAFYSIDELKTVFNFISQNIKYEI
ncbi:MAG: hypothetical protein ACI30S_10245 [Muribaculaceae bacterium]